MDEDLATVARGGAAFHAVRGEYGSGKTFFARWLGRARQASRARHVRDPDLGDRDTVAPAGDGLPPAHRTADHRDAPTAARFGPVVDSWLYTLEEEVLDDRRGRPRTTSRRWPRRSRR